MALQHFYSRVPAKVSMFNRADGFDTFACSDLLDEETITGDFACVYNSKPNKDEVSLIRNEMIPPVYFHYKGKSGNFIQSCISFLKLDYTGERTSYLVHSLSMDEKEEKEILFSPDNEVLNPSLFVHNLDGFDITSFDSYANDEYPTLEYSVNKSKGTADFVNRYDQDMVKRLIYAVLTVSCGKGKPVYISLCNDIGECSVKTLDFLNTFLQIFPYHIRSRMSFVTYTPDAVKYSDFKIKGIVESFSDIPTSKGIVLHFNQRISLGLQDELVMSEKFVVDFFYELLKNDQLRREFLSYVESVYEKMPELSKTTMKNIRELVLLFCVCSGLYNEKTVLPNDDSVHDFVCVYDKYRMALSDEFRSNSMICLKRFPLAHAQIPSKTFGKIIKFYPTETVASKKIIMSVMLDLIHTDAMRSKLFNFLKANYSDEPEFTKHQITENLCRVYYGGFLRPQILEFFDEIFSSESEENQDIIFERILLTVRTDGIRQQIFGFIDKYYDSFTMNQKNKLFLTFNEVAVDNSSLSEEFATLINNHIVSDTASQKSFDEMFCKTIEKEQKRKEHPLLQLISTGKYDYLYKVLCDKVFGDWQSRAIVNNFISTIFSGGFSLGISNIVKIMSGNNNISDEVSQKIINVIVSQIEEEKSKIKVADLIKTEISLSNVLKKSSVSIISDTIYPLVIGKISDIFYSENGLELLEQYADLHPEISSVNEYSPVDNYYSAENAVGKGNIGDFFKCCFKFNKRQLFAICEILKKNISEIKSEKDILYEFSLKICQVIYSDKDIDFLKIFDDFKNRYLSLENSDNVDDFEISKKCLISFINVLNDFCNAVPDELKDEITDKLKYSSSVISDFKSNYKKLAEKWFAEKQKTDFSSLNDILNNTLLYSDKSSGSSSSWLSKLFKK